MSILSIIAFFIITYGLGHSVTWWMKDRLEERILMRIGIGLGVWALLTVLVDLLGLPVDWRLFLVLAVAYPLYDAFKHRPRFKRPAASLPNLIVLIVLLLFGFTLLMYTTGAFAYPWLEDDDPWAHATGIKHISVERDIADPHSQFFYIEPYPPAYDAILGILHQTSPDLRWTMKFFNALIISLGIPLFFLLARRMLGGSLKALYATLVLTFLPSYLSHFIWAHSLAMTLLIASLYCLWRAEERWEWALAGGLVIAGICLTQPTQPIKFAFLYAILAAVRWIASRRVPLTTLAGFLGGYLLSALWWATRWRAMIFKGSDGAVDVAGGIGGIGGLWGALQKAFPNHSGTATRAYTFEDFFTAKAQNMINNPVGLGWLIALLGILGVILIVLSWSNASRERKSQRAIVAFWALFTFLGINSLTFNLPFGLFAFRFWSLFAIPLSLLCAEAIAFLVGQAHAYRVPRTVSVVVLVALLWASAGSAKWQLNTTQWTPGVGWAGPEELSLYASLAEQVPPNTPVFAFSYDEKVIGWGLWSCQWCVEVVGFRDGLLNRSAEEIVAWVRANDYQYLILDGPGSYNTHRRTYGDNLTVERLTTLFSEIPLHSDTEAVFQNNAGAVLRLG